MQVVKINPHGFCQGVQNALDLAYKAKKENPKKTVYLLGLLVHNEEVISSLTNDGFVVLDETTASLYELLNQIPNGQVLLFSAHGHPEELDKLALEKSLIVYDASCPFVQANLKLAKQKAATSPIIYIGSKGHLECSSFLANCPQAHFYDVKRDELDSPVSKNPYVISQTTLSGEELSKAHKFLRKAYPNLELGPERCLATRQRQQAIVDVPKTCDVTIILGSKRSNNSQKLFEIALSEGQDAHLVLNLEQLKKIDLKEKKKAALSSGASTSQQTYDACLAYLENL